MQLYARLRRTAAYSIAVIALRYQRQLGVADSAGQMIDSAKRPLEAYQIRGALKWSKDCCGPSLALWRGLLPRLSEGQLPEAALAAFAKSTEKCASDIPRVHKEHKIRSVGPFYE